MKFPSLPFAAVLWDDAHSPNATDTFSPDTIVKEHVAVKVVTVGWVLRDDDYGISIAGEWTGDDDYRSVTVITRAMLVEVVPLSKPRRRRKVKDVEE